jgi:hypothetical protein
MLPPSYTKLLIQKNFKIKVKVKNKIHPIRIYKVPKVEQKYFYSFFNLGERWVWVVNATCRLFTPGKETRYSLYKRMGGPGFDPQTVPCLSSRHTGYDILAFKGLKDIY